MVTFEFIPIFNPFIQNPTSVSVTKSRDYKELLQFF